MSAALKERLSKNRRRRPSFQSPVQHDPKRACAEALPSSRQADAASGGGGGDSSPAMPSSNDCPTPIRPLSTARKLSREPIDGGHRRDDSEHSLSSMVLPQMMSVRGEEEPSTACQPPSALLQADAAVSPPSERHGVDAASPSSVYVKASGQADGSSPAPSSAVRDPATPSVGVDSRAGTSSTPPTTTSPSDSVTSAASATSLLSPPSTPMTVAPAAGFLSGHPDDTFSSQDSRVQSSQDRAADGQSEDAGLALEHEQLTAKLAEHREALRKLRLVQLYRSKHGIGELENLIRKWRQAGQSGLEELHALLPEPRPSMAEFLRQAQVDTGLIKYNAEDETFHD